MKCTRLVEWYERNGDDPTRTMQEGSRRPDGPLSSDAATAGWSDVLAHARGCPDCAFAMESRATLLETLRELPEPVPPADLNARIGQYIDLEAEESGDPDATANLIDDLLGRWLRPIQIALTAACVVTMVSILLPGRLPESGSRLNRPADTFRAAAPLSAPADVRNPSPLPQGQALARLSDADVAAFMRRLEEYRHSHPEIDEPRTAFPTGMLAADR
ncbi:MAG TPA: hypothetical protein VIV61_10505 [Candidatus Ozemobacteraceae bacterium]